MRPLAQIQQQIIAKIKEDETLSSRLTSTSKTAVWRLWVYIISFAIWLHEKIVENNARQSRVHTLDWYRAQAMAFQDGVDLIWNNGQFEFEKVEDVEKRKIIHRCAVIESPDGELIIKAATEAEGKLQPVQSDQQLRFEIYMNEIKDAGNRLQIVNRPADRLKIEMTVYVDALEIDLQTGRLLSIDKDTAVYPVKEAIAHYLAHLPFNAILIAENLETAVKQAQGVLTLNTNVLQWKYGSLPYEAVGVFVIPDSGYFEIEELNLIYKVLNEKKDE